MWETFDLIMRINFENLSPKQLKIHPSNLDLFKKVTQSSYRAFLQHEGLDLNQRDNFDDMTLIEEFMLYIVSWNLGYKDFGLFLAKFWNDSVINITDNGYIKNKITVHKNAYNKAFKVWFKQCFKNQDEFLTVYENENLLTAAGEVKNLHFLKLALENGADLSARAPSGLNAFEAAFYNCTDTTDIMCLVLSWNQKELPLEIIPADPFLLDILHQHDITPMNHPVIVKSLKMFSGNFILNNRFPTKGNKHKDKLAEKIYPTTNGPNIEFAPFIKALEDTKNAEHNPDRARQHLKLAFMSDEINVFVLRRVYKELLNYTDEELNFLTCKDIQLEIGHVLQVFNEQFHQLSGRDENSIIDAEFMSILINSAISNNLPFTSDAGFWSRLMDIVELTAPPKIDYESTERMIKNGSFDIVQKLTIIDKNALVMNSENGQTVLHYYAALLDVKTLKALALAEVEMLHLDNQGRSPLYIYLQRINSKYDKLLNSEEYQKISPDEMGDIIHKMHFDLFDFVEILVKKGYSFNEDKMLTQFPVFALYASENNEFNMADLLYYLNNPIAIHCTKKMLVLLKETDYFNQYFEGDDSSELSGESENSGDYSFDSE